MLGRTNDAETSNTPSSFRLPPCNRKIKCATWRRSTKTRGKQNSGLVSSYFLEKGLEGTNIQWM